MTSNGSSMGLALSTLAGSFPNPSFKSSSTYLSTHTTLGGGVSAKKKGGETTRSFFEYYCVRECQRRERVSELPSLLLLPPTSLVPVGPSIEFRTNRNEQRRRKK